MASPTSFSQFFFNQFNTKRLFLIKFFKICLFIYSSERLLAMFSDNHFLWLRDMTSYSAWDCNFLAKCFLENVFDLERKRNLISELFRYVWIPRVKQSKRSRWTPFWERDLKAVPYERHCLLSCGFVCRARKLAVVWICLYVRGLNEKTLDTICTQKQLSHATMKWMCQ